jgi:hypothetical protein
MSVSTAPSDDQVMDSVAEAVADAAKSVAQTHANRGENVTGETDLISRIGYNSAYAIAFGIVYPVVLVTQWLPQDNPVMHGFRDGAQAVMDSLKGA